MGNSSSNIKRNFYEEYIERFIKNDLHSSYSKNNFVLPDPETKLILNLFNRNDRENSYSHGIIVDLSFQCKDYTYKFNNREYIYKPKNRKNKHVSAYNRNLKLGFIIYKLLHNQFIINRDPETANYKLTISVDPENEYDQGLDMENIVFVLKPTKESLFKHILELEEELRKK
jgi:hypothetical protein